MTNLDLEDEKTYEIEVCKIYSFIRLRLDGNTFFRWFHSAPGASYPFRHCGRMGRRNLLACIWTVPALPKISGAYRRNVLSSLRETNRMVNSHCASV